MGIKDPLLAKGEDADEYVQMQAKRGEKNKKKTGNCFLLIKSCFSKYYPKKLKKAWTEQGQFLRTILLWCTIIHCLMFVFALAMVGFPSMMDNLILSAWCLSIYYTLKQVPIITYILFLAFSIVMNLWYGLWSKEDSKQQIGLVIITIMYGVGIWWVAIAYYKFYKSGGIKGTSKTKSELEKAGVEASLRMDEEAGK